MTKDQLLKENAELKQPIQSMSDSIDSMIKSMDVMAASSEKQTQTIAELVKTIEALKEQLGKNSKNSSKPPSSDCLAKLNPKSLHTSTGRNPGRQKGHKGSGLTLMATPDETIVHKPIVCACYPHEGECITLS